MTCTLNFWEKLKKAVSYPRAQALRASAAFVLYGPACSLSKIQGQTAWLAAGMSPMATHGHPRLSTQNLIIYIYYFAPFVPAHSKPSELREGHDHTLFSHAGSRHGPERENTHPHVSELCLLCKGRTSQQDVSGPPLEFQMPEFR